MALLAHLPRLRARERLERLKDMPQVRLTPDGYLELCRVAFEDEEVAQRAASRYAMELEREQRTGAR